ncbi:hypothetical protein R1sor_022315 [Riccia sorocarpa]|uniref:Reverse transcriptase zinc-binding domain-containing protein n=1 Tax=Riccia sorocarpa TaxID=122646 RepID=A0ABD3GNR2_9MARC
MRHMGWDALIIETTHATHELSPLQPSVTSLGPLYHLLITNIRYIADEAVLGLKLHRQQQGEERATSGRRHNKSLHCPEEDAYISIDGMDQNNTILPHFVKVPKSLDLASLVGVHLVGAMIYHRTFRTKVFATYKNVRSDSNLTVSIIHRIIMDWEGPLPPTLYIQLDNTVRENKNANVFAYLAMLIDKKIFRKIKVGFLMVGHTHDHVDQIFSRFSVALRKRQAFTMPELRMVIQESYSPSPSFEVLEETWDFKNILQTEPVSVLPLHDVTFNQQFKIVMDNESWPRLWTKKFNTDERWVPEEGVRHLVFFPDFSQLRAAPLVAMKSHASKRPKGSGREGSSLDPLQSFNVIKKDIQTLCFSYFTEDQKEWWRNWFLLQEDYAARTKSGLSIALLRQWHWRAPQDDLNSRHHQPTTVVTSGDLQQRVFGERRPAYAGTRRLRPGTAEHDRVNRIGDLKDLSAGQMMAVLAEDDKSFWLCKVLKIKTFTDDKEPDEVEVQWFATEAEDPYVGKYYPEKRKGDARSRTVLFKQTLSLSGIRILAFDFTLTTALRLRKSTASQIRTQLFRLEQEVAVENADDVHTSENEESSEGGKTSADGPAGNEAVLVVLRHVLKNLPNHLLVNLTLPQDSIKALEGVCRKFIWGKNLEGRDKIPLICWDDIHCSKGQGGLNIPSFSLQSRALRLRQMLQFFQEPEDDWKVALGALVSNTCSKGNWPRSMPFWEPGEILLAKPPSKIANAPTASGLISIWHSVKKKKLALQQSCFKSPGEMTPDVYLSMGINQAWLTPIEGSVIRSALRKHRVFTISSWADWATRMNSMRPINQTDHDAVETGLTFFCESKYLHQLEWKWTAVPHILKCWSIDTRTCKILVKNKTSRIIKLNKKWQRHDIQRRWRKRLNRLWQSKLPHKDKLWLWKVIQYGLPTADRALKWGKGDAMCHRCQQHPELLEHLLWSCNKTVENWRNYRYITDGLACNIPATSCFIDAFGKAFDGSHPAKYVPFAIMVRNTWLARNEVTFSNRQRIIPLKCVLQGALVVIRSLQRNNPESKTLLRICQDAEDSIQLAIDRLSRSDNETDTSTPQEIGPQLTDSDFSQAPGGSSTPVRISLFDQSQNNRRNDDEGARTLPENPPDFDQDMSHEPERLSLVIRALTPRPDIVSRHSLSDNAGAETD